MLAPLRVAWSRLFGFFRSAKQDDEFLEELESHLAMAEAVKIRQGISPKEARRQARIELGGVTQLREQGRAARGLPLLDTFSLDVKLGLRMLRKSWGLTVIGGLAMTLAIGIGVMVFSLMDGLFAPTLPLEEGERVVALQIWDDKGGSRQKTPVQDYERWRGRLKSLEDFGAFRTVKRNLSTTADGAAPLAVAEMTASGFELARTPPLMGRPLVAPDSEPGADLVAVIGYDLWRSRFSADPAVVGKTLRLGDDVHTIVGVMPEGFAFPVNHSLWTPLKLDFSAGPPLPNDSDSGAIFARLGPGSTLRSAETELLSLGLLETTVASHSERQLRPRMVDYPFAFVGDLEPGETPWVVRVILGLLTLLLVPPCANIAILVYARTITRQEEFASRFALGAGRGRIVAQIFIEVLVLASVAALLALVFVHHAGQTLQAFLERTASESLPFWIRFGLSWRTVLFAAVLALVAATIAGVVPAWKATGRKMQESFRALGSGTSIQLGRTWTLLVVVQVALTLAALPSAVQMGWGTVRSGALGPGFAAEEYLTARLTLDDDGIEAANGDAAAAQAFRVLEENLTRGLGAEAGVLGVSVLDAVPGDEPWAVVEVEGVELESKGVIDNRAVVQFNAVDRAFFEVFDASLLMGRTFEAADFEGVSRALVVDRTFANLLLEDRNPLGQRVRYTRTVDGATLGVGHVEPWFEIVGVVPDLPAHGGNGTVYHPRRPGQSVSASLAIRVGYDPELLAPRLRELSAGLDPFLGVEEVFTLDDIYREQEIGNNIGASSLVLVTLSVLLLSSAGIYALLSFTVNQRRREIGIRAALGAQPHRLLLGIFRRSLVQIGAGVVLGSVIAVALDAYIPIDQVGGWPIPGVIPATGLFMAIVGLLAASGPALRGLRVDPIAELREG